MSIFLLIAEAIRTRRQFGIGLWRQFRQACSLRFGPGQLDPWEYYFFRVFLDLYPPDEKRRFVGWRREIQLDRQANARDARGPANDKLAFHALLERHHLPLPKIIAIYGRGNLTMPGTLLLNDPDSLENFLNQPDLYPLFVKPVRGSQGKNVFVLHGLENGRLNLSANKQCNPADFIERLEPLYQHGVLFQELLRPSPRIVSICGPRLTSVRIIVIVTPKGLEILSAVWRVPTGANITDNFSCGVNGNIIAGIELTTGHIQRIVRGIGWENIPVDRHPDTGIEFSGLHLPDWQKACELCLEAASLFPGLRLQHWDVALTDRGPVMLEVNVEGGMRTHQIVRQRGLYSSRLREACERF